MTLTEFLLARIAEDDARAARLAEHWRHNGGVIDLTLNPAPAQVRADCAAKRRIVELHSGDHECSTFDHNGDVDNCTWVIGDECSTMRLLALPFAWHRDYREAWRL